MRYKLMCAGALAFVCIPVFAQSSVTLYGIVDAGIVVDSGGSKGRLVKLDSGVGNASRLGFKGSEDLGGGWRGIFTLEMGMNLNNGSLGQGGLEFGRQAFVGLTSPYGTLTAGRQYTPQFITMAKADPFVTAYAGNATNLLSSTPGARANNGVKYVSPTVSGVTGELFYAFGNVAGDFQAMSQYGAALYYGNDKLNIRAGYSNRSNDGVKPVADGRAQNLLFSVNYDFDIAKLWLAYGIDNGPNSAPLSGTPNAFGGVPPTASSNSRDYLIGVSVPHGPHTFLASVIGKKDETTLNQSAIQVAVGYVYALSKRTTVYVAFAHMFNKNGAGYTVGNAIDPGTGSQAFNFGISQTF